MTHSFRQQFFYYKGMMNDSQPSGAYIFRPNGTPIEVGKAQLEVLKVGIYHTNMRSLQELVRN
ncbi:hypothetical protein COOONC_06695 [Cooperia oncophora]